MVGLHDFQSFFEGVNVAGILVFRQELSDLLDCSLLTSTNSCVDHYFEEMRKGFEAGKRMIRLL